MQDEHQRRSSRLRHPRREAGPQSHGTPPEFAGLPKERHHANAARGGPWRPQERRRGCSPMQGGHSCPTPPASCAPGRPPSRSPSPRVRVRRRDGRRAGRPGQSRHRQSLRGPRRHRRHEHRSVGAQRRSRGLARDSARPASASPPWSTAPRTTTTRVAAQAQADLTTAYNVAAGQPVRRQRPHRHDLGNRTLDGRAPTATPPRRCSPGRSPSTPRATPTRSSSSRSARR